MPIQSVRKKDPEQAEESAHCVRQWLRFNHGKPARTRFPASQLARDVSAEPP